MKKRGKVAAKGRRPERQPKKRKFFLIMWIIIAVAVIAAIYVLFIPWGKEGSCKDLCGDGTCDEVVCEAIGCPCAETLESCPEDCKQGITNMANPAAVYCEDLNYHDEIITAADGSQSGICVFPDSTSCDDWAFYRGKCGQKFTFCEQHGFRIETRTENMGTWTAEYAVCIFDDGSECSEQDYFEGKCSRSECRKWNELDGCLNLV
jgi:hypothetical protein